MNKYQFFEHKECEFYPCHASQEINCMFCYCPAYRFVQCPGNPQWLDNGIKDCSSCLFPHIKSHYQQMMEFLSQQNQVVKVNNPQRIAYFFQDYQNTMIQSYLDGYLGEAYVDDSHHAQSAMILIGDFCFLAGKPNQALLKSINRQFVIAVYQNLEWETFIQNLYGSKVNKHTRYATKKEMSYFHRDELKHNIQLLDSDYTLTAINEQIYKQLLLEDWSKDLVSNYSSFEEFSQYGMGFVITKDKIIISGREFDS